MLRYKIERRLSLTHDSAAKSYEAAVSENNTQHIMNHTTKLERMMQMKFTQKQELIAQVTELLEKLIEVESVKDNPQPEVTADKTLEMRTVKECAALVPGLSEHTVRMLVKQNKVKYIRCGVGKRGKILVSKDSLIKYLGTM